MVYRRLERWWVFLLVGIGWCWPTDGLALGPDEVLVIANRLSVQGVRLARYYMEKRGIAADRLLLVAVADKEVCSRDMYNTLIADRVRRYLDEKDPKRQVRCFVTVYGMPLKIGPPSIAAHAKSEAKTLRKRRKALDMELKGLGTPKSDRAETLKKEISVINRRLDDLTRRNQRSSLDSELALVLAGSYVLSGWVPNPHFIGFKGKVLPIEKKDVRMVSRLDGPTPAVVRRIIDDTLQVEKDGLVGTAYFDARWVNPDAGKLKGYALYDQSIHGAADRVKRSGRMEVVVNDQSELFQAGEGVDAALYCGWYSLGKYVDAFKWRPGAVGFHIASSECRTLKQPGSQVWCKRMLEEGVAATVGPTSEPYVQAFPVPEIFFGLLVDGRLTLAECYTASIPYWSWQMVLIGDPLYRPFKMDNGERKR